MRQTLHHFLTARRQLPEGPRKPRGDLQFGFLVPTCGLSGLEARRMAV